MLNHVKRISGEGEGGVKSVLPRGWTLASMILTLLIGERVVERHCLGLFFIIIPFFEFCSFLMKYES